MRGRVHHLTRWPLFHDLPGVHDGDPVRKASDHRQIVRDVQHRNSVLAPQTHKLVEDSRLSDHVQASRGLVQHDHRWVTRQRNRHTQALLLPAGQLVRVPSLKLIVAREAHALENRRHRPAADSRPAVSAQHLRYRAPHSKRRH
jgi:hypothetical protein